MISANSMQFLEQLGGLTSYVEPDENQEAQAYKLVPVTHWHQGNKFPHRVIMDLKAQSFRRTQVEGTEYYMVPLQNAKVPYLRVGLEEKNTYDGPVPEAVSKYMSAEPKVKRVVKKIGK